MRMTAPMAWLSIAAAPAVVHAAVPGSGSGSDCGQSGSTAAIVECRDAETKQWDRRLNAAYKALQQRVDAGQRQPLTAAQRLWVRYRDANCGFYAAGEGAVSRVLAAECMRTMTRQRACELESAGSAETGAGPGCR